MNTLKDELLTLIRESDRHMTAEEVFLLAKSKNIKVSVASVYRVLGKLSDDGMIRRLSQPGSPDFFDKNTGDHGHMICSVCGTIEDINVAGLKTRIEGLIGQSIEDYELSVSYVCPQCKGMGQN